MKLFIDCDNTFYNRIPMIKESLEELGHEVVLPIDYEQPNLERELRFLDEQKYIEFKKGKLNQNRKIIRSVDGVLILNFDKGKGNDKNYINVTTFLGMYDTFKLKKDIYLWNNIPNNNFQDEIISFSPTVIDGDMKNIPMINTIQKNILSYLENYVFKKEPVYDGIISTIADRLHEDLNICKTEIDALVNKEMVNKLNLNRIGTSINYYVISDKGLEYLENNCEKNKTKVKSL